MFSRAACDTLGAYIRKTPKNGLLEVHIGKNIHDWTNLSNIKIQHHIRFQRLKFKPYEAYTFSLIKE